jgi:outer membrane protein OmpA-like peptidoglycan-associated protein
LGFSEPRGAEFHNLEEKRMNTPSGPGTHAPAELSWNRFLPWLIGAVVLLFLLSLLSQGCCGNRTAAPPFASASPAGSSPTASSTTGAAGAAAAAFTFPGKFSFGAGATDANPSLLASLLDWLKAHPGDRVALTGLFDPANANGPALAHDRAEALRKALMDGGISCDRLALNAAVATDAASAAADKNAADAVRVETAPAETFSMPTRICFNTGKSDVSAEPGGRMAGLIDWMKSDASRRVALTGYTDRVGDQTSNEVLAKDRALAVRAALEAAGIGPERVKMAPPAQVETGAAGPDADARRVDAVPWLALPARLYFDSGKGETNAEGKNDLAAVVAQLKAEPARKVAITGYTDKSGNLKLNLVLAKKRALGVRAALLAAGIEKGRIEMRPPESVEIGAGGNDAQARRVEIN